MRIAVGVGLPPQRLCQRRSGFAAFFDESDRGFGAGSGHGPLHDRPFGHGDSIAGYRSVHVSGIAYFDMPVRDDIAFHSTGNDDRGSLECAFPKALACDRDSPGQITIAMDFTAYHEISTAGQRTAYLAALTDQCSGAAAGVSQTA